MNIDQIVSMARMMLPKNSPWLAKIDQARQMAAQFSQSPDGVRQLMQQMGKSQADVQSALSALNNPAVSGMLNRVSPGLVDQLRSAGSSIAQQTAPSPQPAPSSGSGDSLAALREKLSRL